MSAKQIQILIVDDDPNLLKTLSDILKVKGYTSVTANTGQQGLEQLTTTAPAVALVDLKLEDMSGLDVVRKIKNRMPGTECIIVTGYASQTSAIEAINLGVYGYVQKPYDIEQLLLTIHRAIEKREAEAELQAEQALLAQRVAERTAELSRANAELARAARLKDEFLANMSHELRTPLNAVLGRTEAVREGVHGPLTSEQEEALDTVDESARHLLSLINDILDVSKIEAGKMELEIVPTDIEPICEASLRMIKESAHKKRLRISSSFDSKVSIIQADPRRVKQILVNLLSNAVKFTPEDGEIGLKVVGDEKQESVHFTVWDTGIGIATEEISRLFQPFVQLDSSLSREHAGTGLGLSLISRLTDMHGGSVTVESNGVPGQGSQFIVSLPWSVEESTRFFEEASPSTSPSRDVPEIQRALIVEDSPTAADQLARYLGELGAETIIHPEGKGVVEKVLTVTPEVIILDIQLPHVSGWEVLSQLKAESKTKDIPVLVVSVVDDRSRGRALGAAEYLIKPISRQKLQQTLAEILSASIEETTALVVAPNQEAAGDLPVLLLVEDNEANIATVLNYLEAKGYQIIVARNGLEAIERAREDCPDLIIMDIQMPKMNGLEATRHIRASSDPHLTTIPIIAVTALAMPGDRAKCLDAGANEYLSKPVSLKGLMAMIEKYLQQAKDGH